MVGDLIKVKVSSVEKNFLSTEKEKGKSAKVPAWLERGKDFIGRVSQEPTRDMMDSEIHEQLIVELYSR